MNPNPIGWNFSLPSQAEQPPGGDPHVINAGPPWGGYRNSAAPPPYQATSSSGAPPSIGFVLTPPNHEADAQPSAPPPSDYPALLNSRLGHGSLNRAHSDVIWSPSSQVLDQGPRKPLPPQQILINSISDMAERQKANQPQPHTVEESTPDQGISISRSLSLPHREVASSCPENRSSEYRDGLKKMASLMTDVDLNEDVMRKLKQQFDLNH